MFYGDQEYMDMIIYQHIILNFFSIFLSWIKKNSTNKKTGCFFHLFKDRVFFLYFL